jgi:hypothetical protein
MISAPELLLLPEVFPSRRMGSLFVTYLGDEDEFFFGSVLLKTDAVLE